MVGTTDYPSEGSGVQRLSYSIARLIIPHVLVALDETTEISPEIRYEINQQNKYNPTS
jgi:hypothetical protein